jgi:membrane-associated phospholipid phosphatase
VLVAYARERPLVVDSPKSSRPTFSVTYDAAREPARRLRRRCCVVATAVLPRTRALAWVLAVCLAVGVGWSRLYLGVHWATDVGAGWIIAGLWIVLVVRLSGGGRPSIGPMLAPTVIQLRGH